MGRGLMESMECEGRAAEMESGGKRRSVVAGKREGKELKCPWRQADMGKLNLERETRVYDVLGPSFSFPLKN